MSTQITNKQVKIVSNVNFNEKEIVNSKIDAEKNILLNLPSTVPEFVDSSGLILPQKASFDGEKFLDSSDNKLYTGIEGGYSLKSDVRNDVDFNQANSAVSGFYVEQRQYYNIQRGILRDGCAIEWEGSDKIIKVSFKLFDAPIDDKKYCMFFNSLGAYGTPGLSCVETIHIYNKKLYFSLYQSQYGMSLISETQLFDIDLQVNTRYYLEIVKNDNSATVTLSLNNYNDNVIATNTIETQDNYVENPDGSNYISYGYGTGNVFDIGEIYLYNSTGDFASAGGAYVWNEGENLVNGTQYLDKTNDLLYFYNDDTLYRIGNGPSEQVTLLSITTQPSGSFVKGSQYYNSDTKKIYIAIQDNIWGENGTTPKFGVIYIYNNDGVTEYYLWDGDNLIETDLEKYQLINNISQNYNENNETRYPSSKALNDAVISLKSNIVTKSGSTLPQPTELKVNDTFLNTTDKKIYTVECIYKWADDIQQNGTIIDFTTGAVTQIGYYTNVYLRKTYAESLWYGNKDYKITFKKVNSNNIGLFTFSGNNYRIGFGTKTIDNAEKIHFTYTRYYSTSYGTGIELIDSIICFDTPIEINKQYTLLINKVDTTCNISLVADDVVLETNSFTTVNLNLIYEVNMGSYIYEGGSMPVKMNYLRDYGYIYLLDTSFEFLVPDGELSWSEGEELSNLTWCLDKTNRQFYFYANEQLYNQNNSLMVINNSGKILPSVDDYEIGDTFLNTINKKLYKAKIIEYFANDIIKVGSPTFSSGEIKDFSSNSYIHTESRLNNIPINNIDLHFKTADNITIEQCICCHVSYYQGIYLQRFGIVIKNGSIFVNNYTDEIEQECGQVQPNTEYHIIGNITSMHSSFMFSMSVYEEGEKIYEGFPSIDIATTPTATKYLYFGILVGSNFRSNPFLGIIYGDTNFAGTIYTSTVGWDNGVDIINHMKYADKTNEILYLYEDNDLISIGNSGGGGSITLSQIDYYEQAEVENMVNITGTISIDLDKYLTEINNDRYTETYTFSSELNWKNSNQQVVDLTTLGIDLSLATYTTGSSFDVNSICLRNKTSFTVSQLVDIHSIYLNGILQLKKDYTINNNTITFINYTLKSTDSISII